ncbi:MAG: hypothetical protein ACLP0J_09505 [Solirubrobacteraceae bacterium]|jgi:hypothetical protein
MSNSTAPPVGALAVNCPRCRATAGQPCVDLRSQRAGREIPNYAPHPQRIQRAKNSTKKMS